MMRWYYEAMFTNRWWARSKLWTHHTIPYCCLRCIKNMWFSRTFYSLKMQDTTILHCKKVSFCWVATTITESQMGGTLGNKNRDCVMSSELLACSQSVCLYCVFPSLTCLPYILPPLYTPPFFAEFLILFVAFYLSMSVWDLDKTMVKLTLPHGYLSSQCEVNAVCIAWETSTNIYSQYWGSTTTWKRLWR